MTPRTDALAAKMYDEGLERTFRTEYLFGKFSDMERENAALREDATKLARLVRLLLDNVRDVDLWVRIKGEPNYLGYPLTALADKLDPPPSQVHCYNGEPCLTGGCTEPCKHVPMEGPSNG